MKTKSEIKQMLLAQNIKAKYSGHSKTFYVSQMPNGLTLVEIENSGFNIAIDRI